ncbi:MAG: CotH kinase family protein [Clostridia bacterium]|nr:CotH kinase family protein [Clostridia bacterium]
MKKLFFPLILIFTAFALFSCGESSDCEHIWNPASCDRASSCKLCGETTGSPKGHTWEEETCTEPSHCTSCGKTGAPPTGHTWTTVSCLEKPFCTSCAAYGEPLSHIWKEADCESPKHCERCKMTVGVANGHDWVQTTCTEPKKCSVCGKETTEGLTHEYVFVNCETPRTCSVCGNTEAEAPGHQWEGPFCELPGRCTVCKKATGKALGHDWQPATCVKAESCSRCNKTQGAPIGHTYILTEYVEPSCSAGYELYTCSCGDSKKTTFPAIIFYHTCDEAGLCSKCNVTFDTSLMRLYYIVTDRSGYVKRSGAFRSSETSSTIYKTIVPSDVSNMPIVDLNGNISSLTGKGPVVTIPFAYTDGEMSFECMVEIKVQGASSAGYPKKNYSIKLLNEDGTKHKVELVDGWGKEHKYCMKANWVDVSHARNVVSGKIYGDVIDYRDTVDELTDLVNGGAIDGYPIMVYNDGIFLGLYTMNIPKDKWMLDMKDSDEKKQAIVMTIDWTNSAAMRETIVYSSYSDKWTSSSGWELEYASNEDSLIDNSTVWVAESLNNLIRFVLDNDGQDFKNGIRDYIDLEKCIDSMIYTFFICADDNISKNILWATFDGVHWFSSVYDMDGTWGMQWNGNMSFVNGDTHLINVLESHNNWKYNLLWEKLYLNFFDEIAARYAELRQGPLSYLNIEKRFTDFFNLIPDLVYAAEKTKWPNAPRKDNNTLKQILEYTALRIKKMDAILMPNG